ncbi:fimbria/pilus periplasmic chaperone [Salmonella enterica]|nr:fimbria/pilus periplasmic chaperone [Salmonella enterica]EGK7719933.1 fimbria/pilus periplasmic chaperone [Salmonella enterica]
MRFWGERNCINSLLYVTCIIPFFSSTGSVAVENNPDSGEVQFFSVRAGASRIVYNLGMSGTTLSIYNPQDYPILVQSEVLAEDGESRAPFTVTPPLFRLEGEQSSRLRIIRTGGDFPADRETLQWICAKAIPPKEDDKWAGVDKKKAYKAHVFTQTKVSIRTCLKLFVRPDTVKGHPDEVADSITWNIQGNKLKATNTTPFYMNLKTVTVGGRVIMTREPVAPYSSAEYDLPVGASGQIQWRVINDYGGESNLFKQ